MEERGAFPGGFGDVVLALLNNLRLFLLFGAVKVFTIHYRPPEMSSSHSHSWLQSTLP